MHDYSEIRRRVDILRRVVVILQCALERVRLRSTTDATRLLMSSASRPESHQSIAFVLVLLSSPYAPRNDKQSSKHNRTAYTNHGADDSVPGLWRHAARGITAAARAG